MGSKEPIFVTRPFLPPLREYEEMLIRIWDSHWLTNMGPFHQELEEKLCEHLGVEYISLFSNGTLALITALQAMEITGEVITTPFSFVATTHALHWNKITPVFADIDPVTFNLDPESVEKAITEKTTAILPVHVYGNPCATADLQKIADRHNLKVIYDAAHAFGVRVNDQSVLKIGDLSVLSFHATKVFSTIEGGAIICHDSQMKERIDFLKNFGFSDEVTVVGPGYNAKLNEMQAAFGLLQLRYVKEMISARAQIAHWYYSGLHSRSGIRLPVIPLGVEWNYAYFPILIEEPYPLKRDELFEKLKANNIIPRRYFYPLISTFSPYNLHPSSTQSNLPHAHQIASKVLCLPIYPDLEFEQVELITKIINDV